MKRFFLALVAMSLFTTNLYAKRFANGYAEFELPSGWQCVIEGSEWVCQSENKDRKKEAIIILAAKKRGPQDDLTEYQAYLKQAKTYQLPGAKMQRSEPKSVSTQTINGQKWVDALHLASEVPGFYTRYLATVKADIGVAVTFSVTKSLYNAYKGIFDNVIASMRIFRQANLKIGNLAKNNKGENFDDTVFDTSSAGMDIGAAQVKKRKTGGGESDDFLIYAGIALVALIVILKLKGKGGGGKKKKKKKKKKA